MRAVLSKHHLHCTSHNNVFLMNILATTFVIKSSAVAHVCAHSVGEKKEYLAAV